jgi:hypothetical protein
MGKYDRQTTGQSKRFYIAEPGIRPAKRTLRQKPPSELQKQAYNIFSSREQTGSVEHDADRGRGGVR